MSNKNKRKNKNKPIKRQNSNPIFNEREILLKKGYKENVCQDNIFFKESEYEINTFSKIIEFNITSVNIKSYIISKRYYNIE